MKYQIQSRCADGGYYYCDADRLRLQMTDAVWSVEGETPISEAAAEKNFYDRCVRYLCWRGDDLDCARVHLIGVRVSGFEASALCGGAVDVVHLARCADVLCLLCGAEGQNI